MTRLLFSDVPRAGWVKPHSDQRLSDHISLGVLTKVFPAEVIDEVLAECGRIEVRHDCCRLD